MAEMLTFEHYCGPVRVDARKAEIVRAIRPIVLESLYYEIRTKQELGAYTKKKLTEKA